MQALEAKGYYLARGDQRAFVVVDLHSEVHSLSRQLSGVAKSKELKDRLAGYPLDKLPDVESAQAWAKKQRIEREKQIAEKQDQQEKQPSEVEIRLAALKERQAARRAEIDRQRIDLIARHLSERDGLKAMHESENTGVVSARLQKQPKGILAFLTRITGIQMITDARYRKQDERRAEQQKEQAEALQRRHDRELKEADRHYGALDRLEARENRAARTALHREEFQRIAELVRKPPGRELKPDFDRVAKPVLERTGTDDGRRTTAAKHRGSKQQKGKLVSLFNRFVESLHPEPPQAPDPAPLPVRTDFEKAAKPPIDLTEEFNREVENRRSREERDREQRRPGPQLRSERPQALEVALLLEVRARDGAVPLHLADIFELCVILAPPLFAVSDIPADFRRQRIQPAVVHSPQIGFRKSVSCFPPVLRPRHGAFHEEADARSTAGLSTNCTVARCGLFVAQARMASGSVILKRP